MRDQPIDSSLERIAGMKTENPLVVILGFLEFFVAYNSGSPRFVKDSENYPNPSLVYVKLILGSTRPSTNKRPPRW